MNKGGAPRHDPIPIGDISTPPFVRLPEPSTLFRHRAERFAAVALQHELAPYLKFLGDVCRIQERIQAGLPAPAIPPDDMLKRSRQFGMPLLHGGGLLSDGPFLAILDRLIAMLAEIDMPQTARSALEGLAIPDGATRDAMVQAVLGNAIPAEEIGAHLFVAMALQVHLAHLASALNGERLAPVGEGSCPVCGTVPASSLVVGWHGADGARFCACALCATLWHVVRVKCVLCGSTAGISYQEIEGGPGTIKAETCTTCQRYVKILLQHKDPALDPIADDVASIGLDMLVGETGFRRGGFNPFLVGY